MLHLDCRTEYSLLKGYGKAEDWYSRCKEVGATSFGLADYWGHVPFRSVFQDVKLIYGAQIAVTDTLAKDPRHGIITMLARSSVKPLYEAIALAHEQTYYRPRITWKQLADFDVEVLVNHCSLGSLIDFQKLGKGYLAVGPKPSHMHRAVEELPCVATGAPVYPRVQDRAGYELTQKINNNRDLDCSGYHMLRRSEYESALGDLGIDVKEQWFDNAKLIEDNCNAKIHKASLFHLTGDLRQMAEEGFTRRQVDGEQYRQRLEHELKVIQEKGFEDYFLFVADLVVWAKKNMLVGPGRGSSGGSLLCYLLGITEVDPIRFGTLFERFLDSTRQDYPDIDVDFPDITREMVFSYLSDTYGKDHVARLGTVSKLGGKSAINDVVRAFSIPYAVGRDIGQSYQDGPLDKFFAKPPDEILPLLKDHPDVAKAALLDGVPRHTGVHAAGVCLTKDEISNYGVIDRNGTISLDLKSAEKINMLKMDALGLRTLSVLSDACEQVGLDHDRLYNLDYNDAAVFAVFNRNMVAGVFQFEGQAVRGLMRQMEVENFNDLCALTSLARPGPLVGGAADKYVKRRAALIEWDYEHPCLEPHTKETYGTIVYQEQAMSIVRDIGSFDPGEVNAFRRAVGKKDPVALHGFRQKFIANASDIMGENKANDLWDEMCEFGSYAFNKSHAIAYSMISYMSAWFKAYHPLEFAVAQLRNAANNDQAKAMLRELEQEGYEFVPFDANKSGIDWSITESGLLGGFTSVKGIGKKTAENMIILRDNHGEAWLDHLTESQRKKLTGDNTPWHDLNRFSRLYSKVYEPEYKSETLPNGISGRVLRINEIPDEKGQYVFLGNLTRRQPRTKTNGDEFCNLYFEDDTGVVGCTINKNKWPSYKWLMEDNYDGCDFIIKGNVINDGRVWVFIDNLIQLKQCDKE